MKAVFVVLAHDPPAALGGLVGRLTVPGASFIIHIDRRMSVRPFLEQLPESSSVSHLAEREDGVWGGLGIVQATLHGMRAALTATPDLDFVPWSGGSRSPGVLTRADRGQLKASRRLFAQKLDATLDGQVLAEIGG